MHFYKSNWLQLTGTGVWDSAFYVHFQPFSVVCVSVLFVVSHLLCSRSLLCELTSGESADLIEEVNSSFKTSYSVFKTHFRSVW